MREDRRKRRRREGRGKERRGGRVILMRGGGGGRVGEGLGEGLGEEEELGGLARGQFLVWAILATQRFLCIKIIRK